MHVATITNTLTGDSFLVHIEFDPLILLKSGAIPAGARWITVHPNGQGEKGHPVLVQETKHGSGVFHVIGGAGGKLNYLKLHGIKPESDYKKEAAERHAARRQAKQAQSKRDKELGLTGQKKAARDAIVNQQAEHERKFISAVAKEMGWDDSKLSVSVPAGVSDAAAAKLVREHHAKLMQAAREAVDVNRQKLVADHDARAEAELGPLPLHTDDPASLSVADIAAVKPDAGAGLGFSSDYTERAEKAGLTEDDLSSEAAATREADQAGLSDAQRAAAGQRSEKAKAIRTELEGAREKTDPDLKAKLVDAKTAMELLKHEKMLQAARKAARAAKADLESATEVKAYNLDITADPDVESKIDADIENDLRTVKTRAFLDRIAETSDNPEKDLGKHLATGAFNAVNALATTVAGKAMVDRSVVDVLGVEGAARVLARRIHADMPDEAERITAAMEEYHRDHYMESTADAMRAAEELHDEAKEFGLGEAHNADDLAAAIELTQKRQDAIDEANKILGQTLGEQEANAALVVALKQGRDNRDLQLPMGQISIEDAIKQVRAIGLQRGDYTIETVGKNRILTVKPEGLDRLAAPIDAEDAKRVERNLSIIRGDHDEDNWLPAGIADRPDLAMDVKPGVARSLAIPFEPGDDPEQSLRDYIGSRAADGDHPADILADVQSQAFFEKAGGERYWDTLDAVLPRDEKGKVQTADKLADTFRDYADQFVDRHHGGQIAPMHRQQFTVDQKSVDALHRALSDEPSGVAAYKPIGELTSQDQRTLREWFHANVAKESPEQAALRHEHEQHVANEPEKEVEDMFGTSTNPQWTEWSARKDELAAKVRGAGLDWQQYAGTMRGHKNAYASIQDLIRSKISQRFAEEHNKINPDRPLKLGRESIRGNLNHMDAVDPDAREARAAAEREMIDSMRERQQGRYASGAVSDKLDAMREQKAAFEQAQTNLFGGMDDMFGGGDLFGGQDEPADAPVKPLKADERHTIGHAAERQLAGMMGIVGQNFRPGQPTKLWQPSMNGEGIARQRAVKLIGANKRVALAAGVGSGKTLMQLAGFTEAHAKGDARRALFLVPSVVQGQFGGEALRYLEPGKYKWHAEPGASRDERIAAYKDPSHHFAVMTHQAFRDDMLHLGAKHAGIEPDAMRAKLDSMTPAERKAWAKSVMEKEGINFDYLAVDEGHNLLNRAGKENSGMANVIDAVSAHTPYYVSASVSGDMSILVNWCGVIQRITMQQFSDKIGLDVGEIRSGLGGIRVRCFDWENMRMTWAQVTAIHKFDASKKRCYEIIGAYRKRIVVTEDHSCYVWRDGQALLVRGDCVLPTDQLIIETKIDQEAEPVDELNLLDHIGGANAVVFGDFPEISRFAGAAGYRYRNCGKHGQYLPLNLFREAGCDVGLVSRVSSVRGDSWCDPVIDLKNIAYLIGLYIGDGCMNGNSIQIVMHDNEVDDVMAELGKIGGMNLRLFRIKKKSGNAWAIRVQNYPLAMLFKSWFGGMRSKTKRVPNEIFAASDNVKRDVLRGYEDSDGHRASSNRVTFTSCNRELLEDMSVLLGFLGVPSSIMKRPEPKKVRGNRFDNAGDSYSLSYTDGLHEKLTDRADIVESVKREISAGAKHGSVAKKYGFSKQFVDAISRGTEAKGFGRGRPIFPLSDSAARVPIRSIREVQESFVYDISVDGIANFVANGVLTHNTADPVKNDASEAFSVLEKMDPDRYSDRAAFMRRYGADTKSAREGLRRELARHLYPSRIVPKVRADKREIPVDLSPAQYDEIKALDKHVAAARIARMTGGVDVDAVKALAPSHFEDVPEDQHEAVAKSLTRNVGLLKESAMNRIINDHESSAKLDHVAKLAAERHGKPGVVFAHSLTAVDNLRKRLESSGHKVITLTGSDSSKQKAAKLREFQAEGSTAILVASDAGSTGANLQHGQWLVQYDTPDTAMTHAQRAGRIHRIGQKNDVELVDLVANHAHERRARKRLAEKHELRELMTSPLESLEDDPRGLGHYLSKSKLT